MFIDKINENDRAHTHRAAARYHSSIASSPFSLDMLHGINSAPLLLAPFSSRMETGFAVSRAAQRRCVTSCATIDAGVLPEPGAFCKERRRILDIQHSHDLWLHCSPFLC
jgi:hypothetical protein